MSSWPGNPRDAREFRYGACGYDPASGEATLRYYLDDGPELVERLVFPHAPWPLEASRQAAFEQALVVLHLIAGVSYYKAAVPPHVRFGKPGLAEGLPAFLREVFVQGLAEFAYVNRLDVAARYAPESVPEFRPSPRELLLPRRALVAMGGGKDSLVGLDLLRRAGIEVQPICIGSSSLIAATVGETGLPLLQILRHLAPELAALNTAGAWNGHVPVTAINSAIAVCAAILYGFHYVVFSNERSADEATLITAQGTAVNHQYSKTTAFEREFRRIIHTVISPDIDYFSILRPFSELEIVRRFSRLTRFHDVYSSCNRNFHQLGQAVAGRWCGNCPKCRFAALSLAVFLGPRQVLQIQGVDLLDDPAQMEGFRALCGLGVDKPFECVGESGESRVALAALEQREEWSRHAVVKGLAPALRSVAVPDMDDLMRASSRHFIPAEIMAALPGEFEIANRGA